MDVKAILLGVAFAFIWSSAFSSARIIVEFAPPLLSLAVRFLISGIIGVGIAYALGQTARLTALQWRSIIIFGICQNALYLGMNFVAMQTVEAGLASIIASTLPLLVALSGLVFLSQRMSVMSAVGLVTGMCGVIIILGARIQGGVDLWGVLLCFIGVASLTVATLVVRNAASKGNLLMVVGLQMLVGSAILFVPALAFESFEVTWNWPLVAAFCYTIVMPGLVATVIWFWLVERIGAVKAATFHFLNPFFGVAVAAVFLNEALGVLDVVGVIVITFGILLVQLNRLPEAGKEKR